MDNSTILFWNEKASNVFDIHTNPNDDSRRFAIIHIAIHDAINSIEKKYRCYAMPNGKVKWASLDVAVSKAASLAIHWAIEDVKTYSLELNQLGLGNPFTQAIVEWADNKHKEVDVWYKEQVPAAGLFESQLTKQGRITGEQIGEKAFKAILQKRYNDGRSEVNILSEIPAEGTPRGQFQGTFYNPPPSPPKNKFLSNWGEKVKFFVLSDNNYFKQEGPYNLDLEDDVKEYIKDYKEVKEKGSIATSNTRTNEETSLANKWVSLRQHIVWNNYAVEIIKNKNIDGHLTARILALIHTAMADGATALFKDIYVFYHWRPKTAIRFLDDEISETERDENWESFKPAPRVPEYPSTFGIMGGATGQILTSFFANDVALVDKILKDVEDNAISKIYCGWNFRKSAVDGIEQGKLIGKYVLERSFRPHINVGNIDPIPKHRFKKNIL